MLWVGDMTESETGEGKFYLATILDLFSRHLLGYAMGTHHDAALVGASLKMAATTRGGQVDGVRFTDALHTQHGHGSYLTARGARYLAVFKENRPGLYAQVNGLPWRDIPLEHHRRDKVHHRHEIRRLKVAAFFSIDYLGVRQAIDVVRRRRDLKTGKLTIERIYLITSLGVFDATLAEFAAWIRGHWGIENLLHHVRDRTFREDYSKARTGTLPRTMASLRNLAMWRTRTDLDHAMTLTRELRRIEARSAELVLFQSTVYNGRLGYSSHIR